MTPPHNSTLKDAQSSTKEIASLLDALDEISMEMPPSIFDGPKTFISDSDLLDEFMEFVNSDGRCSANKVMRAQFDVSGSITVVLNVAGSIGAIAAVLIAYLKSKNRKAVFDHKKRKCEFQNYDANEVARMLKHSGTMKIKK